MKAKIIIITFFGMILFDFLAIFFMPVIIQAHGEYWDLSDVSIDTIGLGAFLLIVLLNVLAVLLITMKDEE